MRRSAELDELDLLLVTALQTSPRADWHRLGHLLGISASTAARRWASLTQAGLAWLSSHPLRLPGTQAFAALIHIDTAPGTLHPVATHLANDPHVFDVLHTSGAPGLLVLAGFADQASLARYLTVRLGRLQGCGPPAPSWPPPSTPKAAAGAPTACPPGHHPRRPHATSNPTRSTWR